MIKVLVPKFQLDGCTWYRAKQPLMMAHENEQIQLMEFDPNVLTTEQVFKALKTADVYFLRFSFAQAADFIKELKKTYPTKPIVFDIDDDYFDVNPLNDFYGTMGTKEVYANGKPLWVEGKNFDPYANRKRVIDYEYCLSHATAVTVTTEKLAEETSKYNDRVMIIPNAIDFARFPKIEVKHDDLRLLWSGGSSHYPDLVTVKDDIERLMKDYPTLNLYIYGQVFTGLFTNIDQSRCHYQGWVNADGHGYRLATVGADVAICPLAENEFNQKKSSIKYYETAALGIPTVAKDMLPYSADINGDNGLLYKDDLYSQVKKLLDNPELRKKIGENGYQWVKENRNLENTSKDLADMLNSLVAESFGFFTHKAEEIEKISIVIPTHNRLELAKQTITSLQKHTPRNLYELIVVDDDSTDGTREWLKTQDIDKLIEADHHACGLSKNLGIEAASHEHIYVSDADMFFEEGWYEELFKIYPTLPPIILGALGHPWWPTKYAFEGINLVEQQPGYSWLITKEIYNKCGPLIETRIPGVDDTEFCNRAKKQGIFVGWLPSGKVYHCGITRADGSITYGWEDQVKNYPKHIITK